MTNNLWRNHILPFTLLVGLLGVATLVGDYLLHRFNLVWVGRYLGIPGTLLIIGSLIYSLRKRKMITSGNMKSWLSMHEVGTWLGSLMVLLHAGIHFNAILPWLATVAMGVNVISGMVENYFLAVRVSMSWDSVTTTNCGGCPKRTSSVQCSGMPSPWMP